MILNPDLAGAVRKVHARQGNVMLQTVHDFLGRFVCYPCEHSQIAHSLWILHTHLMDRWDSTPRLAFLSPEPQSGKTRALEISETLVPNPVSTVNVSPAYLFRKVGCEENTPTILYDEIDTVFGPKAKDNEEIRALLNAGHRRGAVAGRCVVRGKTVETEEIPAYAAVAMAGLGWLPDTILSRSVIIRMRRRKTGEQVEPYRRRLHAEEGEQIRILIADWAAKFPTEVKWPELPPRNSRSRRRHMGSADCRGRCRGRPLAAASAGRSNCACNGCQTDRAYPRDQAAQRPQGGVWRRRADVDCSDLDGAAWDRGGALGLEPGSIPPRWGRSIASSNPMRRAEIGAWVSASY
jgi:hypothetical protein